MGTNPINKQEKERAHEVGRGASSFQNGLRLQQLEISHPACKKATLSVFQCTRGKCAVGNHTV